MTEETLAEIIAWLYINDREFESGKEWKEAFIKMLASKRKSKHGWYKILTSEEIEKTVKSGGIKLL